MLVSVVQVARGVPYPPEGNLIVNGSFENGFTGWAGTYGISQPKNYPINPGPLSGLDVGLVDDSEPSMRQTVSTVIGNRYELSFGMRLPDLGSTGHPIDGDSVVGPALLNLAINNQLLTQLLVQNRTTWMIFTFDFTASSTSSELEFSIPHTFILNGQVQESESAFIDNVSMVAVPETTATGFLLALAMAGLVGFGRWRGAAKEQQMTLAA